MKQLIIAICIIVLMLSFSGIASALPGTYMFTMQGNDSNTPESLIEEEMNKWFADHSPQHGPVTLVFHDKVDAPALTGENGLLTLNYVGNPESSETGSWQSDTPVEFYSVKAGNGFAFYWLEGGATSAEWSTLDRENKDISHLSTWNTLGDPVLPPGIPEPGTLLLLSLGLFGVFAVGRKRVKQ